MSSDVENIVDAEGCFDKEACVSCSAVLSCTSLTLFGWLSYLERKQIALKVSTLNVFRDNGVAFCDPPFLLLALPQLNFKNDSFTRIRS